MDDGNVFQWKFSLYAQDPNSGTQKFLGSAQFGKDHDADKIKESLMKAFWTADLAGQVPVVKEADK